MHQHQHIVSKSGLLVVNVYDILTGELDFRRNLSATMADEGFCQVQGEIDVLRKVAQSCTYTIPSACHVRACRKVSYLPDRLIILYLDSLPVNNQRGWVRMSYLRICLFILAVGVVVHVCIIKSISCGRRRRRRHFNIVERRQVILQVRESLT